MTGLRQPKPASLSRIRAAKDAGDSRGDQARRAALTDLVQKAQDLCHHDAIDFFPDALDAIRQVESLAAYSLRIDEAASRLRAADSNTPEAEKAQRDLDSLRENVDTMTEAVSANLDVLAKVLESAGLTQLAYNDACARVAELDDNLRKSKARLSSVSQSVKNVLTLG